MINYGTIIYFESGGIENWFKRSILILWTNVANFKVVEEVDLVN